MERITAANNLVIEYEPERWRLLQNGGGAERVLVETAPDSSLRYPASFGVMRRLPENGTLDPAGVERVVLGWSAKVQTWHLGLMLDPSLAQKRGSRWCALAAWNEPEPDGAAQASKQLASQIQRPFLLVPPKLEPVAVNGAAVTTAIPTVQVPSPQPVTAQPVETLPPPTLPALPYQLDDWRLDRAEDGRLIFTLPGLMRRRVLKALWYLLWVVVFTILSVTSLTTGIAPPQPTFLPYVGIAGAVFLLALAAVTILQARATITRVEVDGLSAVITGFKGNGQVWQYHRDEIEGIYASLVMGKVNRRQQNRRIEYGELNLLLRSGEFVPVISGVDLDDKIDAAFTEDEEVALLNADEVAPLTIYTTRNKVQAAALSVAETLNINAANDRRVR